MHRSTLALWVTLLAASACGRTDFYLLVGGGSETATETFVSGGSETDDTDETSDSNTSSSTTAWGDGDGDPGTTTTTTTTTGDGDPTTGDGDGDPTTTGDGDPTTGDGDGDPNACVDSSDCSDGNCVMGSCEVVATCLELEQLDPNLPSGVYELDHDGPGGDAAYDNYCDLETAGGGWTLILKASGASQTFAYSSSVWTSPNPFSIGNSDLDHKQSKLPSWAWVDFTQVMIGMEYPIGSDPTPLDLETVIVDAADTSLYDLISANNYVATNIGRNAWLGLMPNSALQPNCNREGFNVVGGNQGAWHHVRIGIIGNEQNDCSTPDSRLGIGGAGTVCNTSLDPTGNFVGCNNGNNFNRPAFGVVFVR